MKGSDGIWRTAERINRLCDEYGVPGGRDPVRMECHQLHGECLIRHGDAEDVMGAVEALLARRGYPRAA